MEVKFKVKGEVIAFRGITDGVYLEIKGNNFKLIREELHKKISSFLEFFQGVRFLGVKGKELTDRQILEIGLILKYKYDFDISLEDLLPSIKEFIDSNDLDNEVDNEEIKLSDSEVIEEDMTKFVYGTLRSGQIVEYSGNIVVVGDVNPGGLLKAKGNIIVLGTLRGVAHAGIYGNINAIVAAYNLIPTQLRIADLIVRAPDGDMPQYKLPEVARIYNGEVIIEPYLPNK